MIATLRAGFILLAFVVLTLATIPIQAFFLKVHLRWAAQLPQRYHQAVCALIGVRIHTHGAVVREKAVLLVSNHCSWVDILVLSTLAPMSFIAKHDVASWPGIGLLARLQRSVFVARERRHSVGSTANEVLERLHQGDHIVLFAEGTSSDGNRVLPFKTSLFSVVTPFTRAFVRADGESVAAVQSKDPEDQDHPAFLQTCTLAYVKRWGIPLGRAERPDVAWYGDMVLVPHLWHFLKSGPVDVHVRIGEKLALESFADRKTLASHSEREVRQNLATMLYERNRSSDLGWDL